MNDLTGIGELAKPAEALINKVSEGIGGTLKPWQIKRVAQANAEAKRIETQAEYDATIRKAQAEAIAKCEQERIYRDFNQSFPIDKTIAEPAIRRMVYEEVKKQINMESILFQSIPLLKETATPEAMDEDWVMNFFSKARNISTSDMQRIWAKLLAEEANSPNSFSKRVVNLLSSMSTNDAKAFQQFAEFIFILGGEPKIYSDIILKYYDNVIHSYNDIIKLIDIGIIAENPMHFKLSFASNHIVLDCNDMHFSCELSSPSNILDLGRYRLTYIGIELYKIVKSKTKGNLIDELKECPSWKKQFRKIEKYEPPNLSPEQQKECNDAIAAMGIKVI